MLTNSYKLYFFLPLLATVSKGNEQIDCKSFKDVANFNATSSVVSALGFVESFTIPAGWKSQDHTMKLKTYEYANATVTSYNNGPDKTRHYPDFQKETTIEVKGTDGNSVNWPGFHMTQHPFDVSIRTVNWTSFMSYFEAGGSGLVLDLENYSTLTAIGDKTGKTYGVARPEKLYKLAIASLYPVNMTIFIAHANVLILSCRDCVKSPTIWLPAIWLATDNGEGFVNFNNAFEHYNANTCLVIDKAPTQAPTPASTQPPSPTPKPTTAPSPTPKPTTAHSPTPKPTTASGAASARSSGLLGAFSLLAAASLALR